MTLLGSAPPPITSNNMLRVFGKNDPGRKRDIVDCQKHPKADLRRNSMIHIPALRWGEPYKSLDIDKVVHFNTGEALAEVSRANGGLMGRDMRHAGRARDVLREIPIPELLKMVKKAADLYTKAELP